MIRNRILGALPLEELERLKGSLERVDLELRQVVIEHNQAIEAVYFPETAVVSLVGLMADGSAIEIATVGAEGMVGVPVYLGAMSMSGQAFAQVPGAAYRMRSGDLREEMRRGGVLASLLGRYTQALFTLLSQSSACNRKHALEQRCARWLLLTHDRVGRDSFDLTHHFLSQMLGVRRASVSEVAAQLQARGFITYSRGVMTIRDRSGLERVVCECYGVIASEFARLLENRHLPNPLEQVKTSEGNLSTVGDGTPAVEDTDTPTGAPK